MPMGAALTEGRPGEKLPGYNAWQHKRGPIRSKGLVSRVHALCILSLYSPPVTSLLQECANFVTSLHPIFCAWPLLDISRRRGNCRSPAMPVLAV